MVHLFCQFDSHGFSGTSQKLYQSLDQFQQLTPWSHPFILSLLLQLNHVSQPLILLAQATVRYYLPVPSRLHRAQIRSDRLSNLSFSSGFYTQRRLSNLLHSLLKIYCQQTYRLREESTIRPSYYTVPRKEATSKISPLLRI